MRPWRKRLPSRRGKHKRDLYFCKYALGNRKFQNEMRRMIAAADQEDEWRKDNGQ